MNRAIDRYCVCRTCVHGERQLFGIRCDHPELGYTMAVRDNDTCECHDFAPRFHRVAALVERLLDEWYESVDWDAVARAVGGGK